MRNSRKILIEQLDKKLSFFKKVQSNVVPTTGWINNIRVSLNMSLEQLGNKLGMSKQGVKKIEEREASGTITINSLKEVAEALNMTFIYGFAPKDENLQQLLDKKANILAKKIVQRTNKHMILENQGNSDQTIKDAIVDLKNELKREMHKSLWD
jgi:predicted DNA-binding mobile mystery protein A